MRYPFSVRSPILLAVSLATLAGCSRQPDVPPEVAELLAHYDRMGIPIDRHAIGRLDVDALRAAMDDEAPATEPVRARSPDTVDATALVTAEEIAAVLRRLDAAGDSTARADFEVTLRPAERRMPGYGTRRCQVSWAARVDGAVGAQGNFELAVLDLPTFAMLAQVYERRLPDLGDEAIDALGTPYVRVGDLAVTIADSTGSDALSRGVLAAAARRLR